MRASGDTSSRSPDKSRSFASANSSSSENGEIFIGSVVICEERAKEQAEEYAHSYRRELNYLVVHGLCHLLGYDHMVEEDKAQMRALEEKVLGKMGITRAD